MACGRGAGEPALPSLPPMPSAKKEKTRRARGVAQKAAEEPLSAAAAAAAAAARSSAADARLAAAQKTRGVGQTECGPPPERSRDTGLLAYGKSAWSYDGGARFPIRPLLTCD